MTITLISIDRTVKVKELLDPNDMIFPAVSAILEHAGPFGLK